MSNAIIYDLRGRDRTRFAKYEAARSLQSELRDRADRGWTVDELAAWYRLSPDDVILVLYASRVRCTARVEF